MSLFSEALVLNSGLQRSIPVRLGFMHLNAVTEFETEAVLLKKWSGGSVLSFETRWWDHFCCYVCRRTLEGVGCTPGILQLVGHKFAFVSKRLLDVSCKLLGTICPFQEIMQYLLGQKEGK